MLLGMAEEEAKRWAAKIRALPFLLEQADAVAKTSGEDRYDVMARLRTECEAEGRTYVWSVVYRRPPAKCHTGEHDISAIGHDVVRPGGGGLARLLISERELHDLEHHDRKLLEPQRRKLDAIFDL